MAKKKKKSTRAKAKSKTNSSAAKRASKSELAPARSAEQVAFWQLAAAVLLFIIALLLLLGGFHTGGPLPVGLFHGAYWTFGWAAYILPLALVYWGTYKFKTEDRRIPLPKLVSIAALMVFSAGWFYTIFASQTNGQWHGGHGGYLGKGIGGGVLSFLSQIPAAIIFFVLAVLAVFFALAISPKVILKLGKLFERGERETDTDLGDLKASASETGFQLKEGVPVERGSAEPEVSLAPSRLSSLKNKAKPLTSDQEHEALTAASDPDWEFPSLDLLSQKQDKANAGDVEGNAETIKNTYAHFKIPVEMEGANIGPRITQYTLRPPIGVKLTKITALESNLALDLGAQSIRMEAPIPGKKAVGIEVPNLKSATVRVSSLLGSSQWQNMAKPLGFCIGKDISGTPVVANLGSMPHLLVAGQTGSGKSVMINTILTSLLYHNSPADLKLILVDPKRVELTPYNDIPHLLSPVITEPDKCISALKWSVAEMERRYKALAEVGKRNIEEYNNVKKEEGMPFIVIVIDELSELMMLAARDAESLIVRIAQKARAVGIHLVLATQRPSVDVITGLIKNNVPARIAFAVPSQIDSRTIIDQIGAEKLLGQGDMLLKTADALKPVRVQGAFISDEETTKVTDFLRMQQAPNYNDEVVSQPVQLGNAHGGVVADYGANEADDDMWRDAVGVVVEGGKASTSLLQRRLRIGYGRAARLIETMEEQGIVGSSDGNRPREVLVSSVEEVFGGVEEDAPELAEDEI